jgi:hypothetical protein
MRGAHRALLRNSKSRAGWRSSWHYLSGVAPALAVTARAIKKESSLRIAILIDLKRGTQQNPPPDLS